MSLSNDLNILMGRRYAMTKSQSKKLDAIISRLEALQAEVLDPRVSDSLGRGKRHLMDTFNEHAQR